MFWKTDGSRKGSGREGGGEGIGTWGMKILTSNAPINKCSDRNMEVKLPAFLGNYQRQIDRSTDRRTDWVIGKFHLPKSQENVASLYWHVAGHQAFRSVSGSRSIRIWSFCLDPTPYPRQNQDLYYQTMHTALLIYILIIFCFAFVVTF